MVSVMGDEWGVVSEAEPVSCTVVIPHYGQPALTTELVTALRQDEGDLEIIVVDDGSPEPLGPIPGARIIRLEKNGGFGGAVNTGVRAGRHQTLAVLNSDLRPGPSFLSNLVKAARVEFPAFAGATLTEKGVVMENRNTYPAIWSTVASRSALPFVRNWRPAHEPQPRTAWGNREVAWLSGAALCFPRDLFEQVGGFDEAFFMYYEDVDLQDRLRASGVRRVLLTEVSVEHLAAASSSDESRRQWIIDSSFVYFAKRGRLTALSIAWLTMIATNVAYDVARRMAGKRVDVVGTAVQRWSSMRLGRAAAQRARRNLADDRDARRL